MEMKRKALAAAIAVATALTLTACGGSSGGGGGGTLKMAGGLGGADGGTGGDGDYFETYLYSGGDIILGGGPAADTGFTPTNLNSIPTELGENPLIVTSDLTLAYVAAFGSKPAAGTYYLSGDGGGGYEIRLSDGDTAAFNAGEIVSGVEIARGATLTLSPNSGGTMAWISPDYDVIVKGTLATAELNATDVANLRVDANSVLVHRSGVITTAGVQAGQNSGYMDIYPDYSFINQGQVLSHGADNDAGDAGDGDSQYVYADYYFENTGTMDAHGGDSETGFGGDAGYIDVYANYGDCVSSGNVYAHGGFGELGGGDGDDVYFYAYSVGDVKLSGTVTFYGGDAGAGVGADGGDADYIEFYSYGGGIYSNATLKGWGGSTASADGDGGDGGYIDVYNYEGGHYETSPPMGVNFAGSINMNGGNALATGTGDGGDADSFYVYVADEPTGRQDVAFHFGKIDMNGGDGNYGGDGGDLYVYNNEEYSSALDVYFPSGTNDIRWTTMMNGGDVVRTATGNGYGGEGGQFYIESDYYEASATPEAGLVKVSGNIEMSGGESLNSTSTSDADADYGWLWGYNGVTFANITARGGNDRATDGGTDGYGGDGAYVEIYSELGDIRGGRVDISAGNGEYQGGYADYFASEGHMMRYSLVANGGNADPDLAGSTGGDVDDVYIWSQQGNPGVSGVSVTRKAGTGETAGDEDSYYMILGSTCTGLDC